MRRRIDPDVRVAIERDLVLGYAPSVVMRRLEAEEGLRDRVPSLRTIESMAAELRARDPAETWTVGTASPSDAALVLPVLAELIAAGQITSLTRETGRWVATIRRIVPDLPTLDVLVLAARYQAATARGDSTHPIDLELARLLSERR